MPDESQNVARAREVFAAFATRDFATFDALVSDTATFTLLPESLRFVVPDKATIFDNLGRLTNTGRIKLEVLELIDAPPTGQVITHAKIVDTLAKDGVTPYRNEYIFIFTFNEGKIVRWKAFMDSAYVTAFLAGQKIAEDEFRPT